jgi:hypothetical protein
MITYGIIIIVSTVAILSITAWSLPLLKLGTLINSTTDDHGDSHEVKSKRSFDWIEDSAIGEHWIGFNALAALSSIASSVLVLFSPLSRIVWNSDGRVWALLLIVASTYGFHLVWSTSLDWRFHKIPRWVGVAHMIIMIAASIALTAGTAMMSWVPLSVVIVSIMAWLLGTVPGSGMADGRMYAMVAAGAIPFLSTASIWPAIIASVLAILNAIIVAVGPGGRTTRSDRNVTVFKRIMKTGSPMGPFIMITFTVFLILLTYGVVTSPSSILLTNGVMILS